MSTTRQDHDFGLAFLENIVEWIRDNFEPQDVFGDIALSEWAKHEDYIKDSDVKDYIATEGMDPEDVFDDSDLGKWAKNNGYVKEEA